MKKHFGKLLTEVERAGSSAKSKKWGGRVAADSDEVGGIQAWSRHRNWDYKNFGDNINPLRSFLRSRTGKHWDDVFSELSQLDFSTMSGQHLKSHLKWEVKTNTYLAVDGNVYEGPAPPIRSGIKRDWTPKKRPVEGFYVHPITGILCWRQRTPWRNRRPKPAPKDRVQLGDLDCQLINGVWYAVRRVKLNPNDVVAYRISKIGTKWIWRKRERVDLNAVAERNADGSVTLKDGRTNVFLESVYRHETKGPHEAFEDKRQLGKKVLKLVRAKLKETEVA